jgi:hypothetical protein
MNFYQGRSDISALFQPSATTRGHCYCYGGLGANVTRTTFVNPGSWLALIQ